MSQAATQTATGRLDRIYDAIEVSLPGLNHAVVQMSVWDAIEDFCTKSTFWQATVAWTIPAGGQAVNLNPISGDALVRWVLGVRGLYNYRVEPPATIIDLGPVTDARVGHARVALKPSRLTDNLPSLLVDDWFEAICDGAKARLYAQPAKPYSSPILAERHGRMFRTAISSARSTAMRYNMGEATSGWAFPNPAGRK